MGCLINALAYLVMVAAAWTAGNGKASWLWLFSYFRRHHRRRTLSFTNRPFARDEDRAERSLLSMMMGVWLATSFVGGFLAGYLGMFWSSMDKGNFS